MPRKKREPLMLKFRLRLLEPMPKEEAIRRLKRAIRDGYVPEGIEIHWADWSKGTSGALRQGNIDASDLEALRGFYGAFAQADLRVNRAN